MKPINYHGNYLVMGLTNNCNCNLVYCIRDNGVPYLSKQRFIKKRSVEELEHYLKNAE